MHLLEQNICKISYDGVSDIFYILDVLHPQDLSTTSTRLFAINDKGVIKRIRHSNTICKVLSYDEQIEEYNKTFYKFMPIPEHLKKFITEKEHK